MTNTRECPSRSAIEKNPRAAIGLIATVETHFSGLQAVIITAYKGIQAPMWAGMTSRPPEHSFQVKFLDDRSIGRRLLSSLLNLRISKDGDR